jgi:hypothetical protein
VATGRQVAEPTTPNRNLTMPTITTRTLRLGALALALAAAGVAQANPWTTIGSAGTVDEADTSLADLINGEARMLAAAPAGSVLNIRYNITSLEGFQGLNQVAWRARFRDNGNGARVRLFLRQYNATGTTSTLATFDSNGYAAQVSYQTQTACIGVDWDFEDGPFYIEAELTKSADGGMPALGLTTLTNANCTP